MIGSSQAAWLTFPLLALFAAGCSGPKTAQDSDAPAWVHQPTRVVDNGYIVYVGAADDTGADRAQLKAESAAVEDLANECSFVPKGTRTEDRYTAKEEHGYKSYAKVAIEFQDCEQAKNTVDPAEIRKLANQRLTEQLATYQQLALNEDNDAEDEDEDQTATEQTVAKTSAGSPAPIQSNSQFFVVRQQLAYQKEIVILSPPTSYAPGSPQATQFASNVTPATTQVQGYERANPQVKTWSQSWSGLAERPNVAPPAGLRRASNGMMNPAARNRQRNQWSKARNPRNFSGSKKPGRRRRRRNDRY